MFQKSRLSSVWRLFQHRYSVKSNIHLSRSTFSFSTDVSLEAKHSKLNHDTSKFSKDVPSLKEFLRNSVQLNRNDDIQKNDNNDITTDINVQHHNQVLGNGKKFSIATYGCQMNVSDSEIVRSILEGADYEYTTDTDDADVVFLNTCAVRDNAERKVWGKLEKLCSELKDKHKWQNGRRRVVGVLGCMAERLKDKLLADKKMVHLVAGPDAYRDLPRLLAIVNASNGNEQAINVQLSQDETYADVAPVRTTENRVSAFVSIMRGCNNMCTYCIVPFTRGRERSRDLPSIVEEVRTLSDQGVKEIWLLGQNVNSFHDASTPSTRPEIGYQTASGFTNVYRSRDGDGMRFAELLDRVSSVNPEMRVRFTSPHPKVCNVDVLINTVLPRNSLHSSC